MNTLVSTIAERNLAKLSQNPYPGRGIVIGTSQDGRYAVQIYWIMGRSENSRNRVFKSEGGKVFTEPFDHSKVKDASLIIYNAMLEYKADGGKWCVVSNGDQTDTVYDSIATHYGTSLGDLLRNRVFEPDAPNFTPRITGLSWVDHGVCLSQLALLRKSELTTGDNCERFCYDYGKILPGFGFCLTTYMGDGSPLPAFTGEPYLLLIDGDINDAATEYWQTLNPDNRVSLAVKFINLDTGDSQIKVINKFT